MLSAEAPHDPNSVAPNTPEFLSGGGFMGDQIRSFDWRTTALGAPATWSDSLRTAMRILLTTNHPVFIFWGPELVCIYNDAYSRSLGPEKHPSILGKGGRAVWAEIWDIIGPQIDQVMAGLGATWHENQLVPIIRHGSREEVYWTYGYSPLYERDAPAGVGGVLVLCTETTEQVLASERRQKAQERWRSLFAQAPGFAAILTGPEHRFEFANPAYFELVGRDDIVGKSVATVMPWAVEQGFVALLDRVYRSGEPYRSLSTPTSIPREHGPPALHHLDFLYQAIRDETDRISGVFVLGVDVSAREAATAELRDSEDRLRIACDAAELGIYDYDVRSDAIYWDEKVRALWGLQPGAAPIVSYAEFENTLHHDDRQAVRDAVQRAFDPNGAGHYLADFRIVDPQSGRVRWIQGTGKVSFEHGCAVRMIGTAKDITLLKEANRRREEFLAMLSHELRNPLASLGNALHILRHPNLSRSQADAAVQLMGRQMQQLVSMVDELLDAARVSNGRVSMQMTEVALETIVDTAVEAAAATDAGARHPIRTNFPERTLMVRADPVRLTQVVCNLLVNACKYSDPGSVVAVDVRAQGSDAVVEVTDSGIGIAHEDLVRIFDVFAQSPQALGRAEGGLGIGLAVAKGLVELHGGSISARSAGLGKGSTFSVCLPLLAGMPTPVAATQASRPPAQLDGVRLLVVDDNRDAAESLGFLLTEYGAQVDAAFSGADAIQKACEARPDAVLLDLGLPDVTGYQVAAVLRARLGSRPLLYAMTGYGQESDLQQTADAGFDGHFVKPADPLAVLDTLSPLGRSLRK